MLGRYTPIACMSCVVHARWERERATLKTAKQERTINPDTRLHSDEMREKDEKRRQLARNPTEGNIAKNIRGVMSVELVHQ